VSLKSSKFQRMRNVEFTSHVLNFCYVSIKAIKMQNRGREENKGVDVTKKTLNFTVCELLNQRHR
jgi:hypothetical protein